MLAACIPEGGGPVSSTAATSQPGPFIPNDAPTPEDLLAWERYYVTEFDSAKVEQIRALRGYLANRFTFVLQIDDHPTYGDGVEINAHPLAAARLDYALSTGLTGTGQIVSMIDSAIRLSHEQFTGKQIHSSGDGTETGDFHGTAVASVLAGNGTNGGTLGFAPGADIHQGYLEFDAPVDWIALGSHMRTAADLGAIVSNNSWGLIDFTLRTTAPATFFQNETRRPYLDGLRAFATDGVIVFALQNDYTANSASIMAALPVALTDLEPNWITVINAVPVFNDKEIISAERISAACLETASFCLAANGQIKVAAATNDTAYEVGVGASFAAPQVSGSIALLAEAFPDLTATQLRNRLLATADNGFFTHDAVREFAPGITHGYNAEFGHGFLDLRAALLPIGQAVVPMPTGGSVAVGTPMIMTGSASGDGLAQALAAVNVMATDQLSGRFAVSANSLTGTQMPVDPAAVALVAALAPDMAANRSRLSAALRDGVGLSGYRTAWRDPNGADLLGGETIAMLPAQNDLALAVLNGNGTTGLSLHRTFDLAGAQAQLGFTTMRTDGSFLGVSVPRNSGEISSVTNALDIIVAAPLSPGMALRLDAELGLSEADGAGMIDDFSTVSYNRIGIALERADISRSGDILAVFARQPIGIMRGSASMDLPMQMSAGEVQFTSHNVSLAPAQRQLDLGFEYSVPVMDAGNLSLGMMHSRNDGNIMGRTAVSGFIGVQFGF
ncbi:MULTISPECIES: S8 family peptidase [unclassified Yoonia]|uniref:S8 family peptidase n=1 Tax=unclassified Yoonia TaxID=2629118 RepID=UPI002AFEB937|nr:MULTISPECIES: S8 family peptidase [unclassified Yoonia]